MLKSRLSAWGFSKNSRDKEHQICAWLHKIRKQRGKTDSLFLIHGNKRTLKDRKKYITGRKMSEDEFIDLAEQNISIEQLVDEGSVRAIAPPPECQILEDEWEIDLDELNPPSSLTWVPFKATQASNPRVFERTSRGSKEVLSSDNINIDSSVSTLAPRSTTRGKVLPIVLRAGTALEERFFDAVPDTGSSENAMDRETFKSLGIAIERGHTEGQEFEMANGRRLRSLGQVTVACSFTHGRVSDSLYTLKFNVFPRLASPILIGNEFLSQTETLTKYQYRLKSKRVFRYGMLRVMHLNRPKCRIKCSINGEDVLARADTGAEMNLLSPAFVAKRRKMRSGLVRDNLTIMLADGSVEHITRSFTGRLLFGGVSDRRNLDTTFYVLPGLTSDALIGEDTLYEADVFVKHADAFVELDDSQESLSPNLIKWLTNMERLITNVWSGTPVSQSSQTSAPTNVLRDDAGSSPLFYPTLTEAHVRELHRREQAEHRIVLLPDRDKAAALDAERTRIALYDTERARCLALHQRRVSAAATRVRS